MHYCQFHATLNKQLQWEIIKSNKLTFVSVFSLFAGSLSQQFSGLPFESGLVIEVEDSIPLSSIFNGNHGSMSQWMPCKTAITWQWLLLTSPFSHPSPRIYTWDFDVQTVTFRKKGSWQWQIAVIISCFIQRAGNICFHFRKRVPFYRHIMLVCLVRGLCNYLHAWWINNYCSIARLVQLENQSGN